MISEEKFKRVINEISEEGCACHGKFCTFRLIIELQHADIRMLIQLQCMLKFKYEESARVQKDVGVSSEMKWFESGLAKRFAEVYNEDLSFNEIYRRTVEKYNPITGMVEE